MLRRKNTQKQSALIYIVYTIYICYICYGNLILQTEMKKLIEVNETLLTKLKILSAFEGMSVKALMEKAIEFFVTQKEREQMDNLTNEEKEDIGLLLLMQQTDRSDTVSKKEFFKALNE